MTQPPLRDHTDAHVIMDPARIPPTWVARWVVLDLAIFVVGLIQAMTNGYPARSTSAIFLLNSCVLVSISLLGIVTGLVVGHLRDHLDPNRRIAKSIAVRNLLCLLLNIALGCIVIRTCDVAGLLSSNGPWSSESRGFVLSLLRNHSTLFVLGALQSASLFVDGYVGRQIGGLSIGGMVGLSMRCLFASALAQSAVLMQIATLPPAKAALLFSIFYFPVYSVFAAVRQISVRKSRLIEAALVHKMFEPDGDLNLGELAKYAAQGATAPALRYLRINGFLDGNYDKDRIFVDALPNDQAITYEAYAILVRELNRSATLNEYRRLKEKDGQRSEAAYRTEELLAALEKKISAKKNL